jgi:hypothetical protein
LIGSAANRYQHDPFALSPAALRLHSKRRRIDTQLGQQRFVADGDAARRHCRDDTFAGFGAKRRDG